MGPHAAPTRTGCRGGRAQWKTSAAAAIYNPLCLGGGPAHLTSELTLQNPKGGAGSTPESQPGCPAWEGHASTAQGQRRMGDIVPIHGHSVPTGWRHFNSRWTKEVWVSLQADSPTRDVCFWFSISISPHLLFLNHSGASWMLPVDYQHGVCMGLHLGNSYRSVFS